MRNVIITLDEEVVRWTRIRAAKGDTSVSRLVGEAAPRERTLINTTADLSKPEIGIRWYLGDVGPFPSTNHMEDRMSEYYTFRF